MFLAANYCIQARVAHSLLIQLNCAYCYWPGTGGRYFPTAKLQDETNMADLHNKTDLVRSITYHQRGVGWSYFLLAITQSNFPLNTQVAYADVLTLKFWPTYRSLQHSNF